ncbi:mRNA stability protein [Zancudomyces culisetae]|uniref:mRNA stability protein n=1 Tax=Zancudomyces culisetae TaxID=1213189 RepID=A0A1R1PTF6_ZANCU|nr:mRNA stability protein [Zancudomyces culisetae]|eukprot:OMH84250.1 mRNA stability protein [Zancudomyces culisetae]
MEKASLEKYKKEMGYDAGFVDWFERKYFDSGDYALSKAGNSETTVGEKHPSPESIPHQQIHQASSNYAIGGTGAVGTMAKESNLIKESDILPNQAQIPTQPLSQPQPNTQIKIQVQPADK